MARELSLPLHELIGIPIADLVRAEVEAAKASMAFIEAVGFHRDRDRKGDDFGQLRMITFRYRVPNGSAKDGDEREVQVPLLSLLPLPLLQIAKAEIELVARVEGVRPADGDISDLARESVAPILGERRHQIVATIDTDAADTGKDRASRIRFKLEVKQSDIPAGLSYLLRKLDQNAGERVG